MVDLPLLPDRIVTSTAPTSSVSRQDIISSNNMMAKALSDVADTTMDIATKQAKEQAAQDMAQQKVVRNDDGSVGIVSPANSVIFGRAGEAYGEAVKAGTIAQTGNVMSQEMAQLHTKHAADPAGFQAASNAFLERFTIDNPGITGGIAAQRGRELQTQHFNSITNTTANLDLKQQDGEITASQARARSDVITMMRGGASINDKAVQDRIAQYDATIEARVANPLFGYGKAQAQADRETFQSEATAAKLLFEVDKVYKNPAGGYQKAMDAAHDILTNPGYRLDETARERFYHKAVQEIRTNEAIRKQDIDQARGAYNELALRSASGVKIESDEVEQVAKAFEAAGDPSGRARVYSNFIRKPLNDDFGRQPLATQTLQLNALRGSNAAAQAQQFFLSKGYTPEQAAGIVGNLVHESGLDPTVTHDVDPATGKPTGLGIAGFRNERRTALRKFAEERGKPATDFQTQLEFVDQELRTTETGTLAKLQSATTPEQAAHAFIDYERPQGWTAQNPAAGHGYQSRLAIARAVFNGRPGDMSMGPAGSAWLIANRQATVDDAATKQWRTVMADYDKEGIRPSLAVVNDTIDGARAAGNANLLDVITRDSARMDLARDVTRAPLATQQNAISTLETAGSAGQLSPGHAALMRDLEKRNTEMLKGLDTNPVATTVANFPDKFKPVAPLDFSSEGALAGGLAERAAIAGFAAQNWQTPPLSVLDEADVKQIQVALQSPQGARVLTTMTQALKPDDMLKLLDNKPFRDSITGLQSSQDPGKMSAANQVADALWRRDPALAESLLGSKAIDKLHAWQGLKDTFTAEEIAANLNAPRDPAVMKVREESRKAALTETANLKPADVAYKLGTSWGIPIVSSLVNPITGATPAVPFDSIAAGVLTNDYQQTYAALRADGLDEDKASSQAMERLKSIWGVSAAAGNRLMKNAPEMSPRYPAIDGSKGWISDEVREHVSKQVGPQFIGKRSAEMVGFTEQQKLWDIAGLVSDATTQADVSSGRPPSYQVAIRRGDGTLDILPGRTTFDPAKHIAAWETKLQRRQQSAAMTREFNTGMPLP